MRNEDLELISTLGQALYANPGQAETRSLETVAAISTLESVSESEFLERSLGLMLHQAERDGLRSTIDGVSSPFFRLEPKERFVLFLLHSGRMSYRKLAALLQTAPEEIQTLAWAARTRIASSPEIRRAAPHPTGSSHLKQSCPEFDSTRPWTQKLIDDEMGTKELAFLQNHTAICADCRRALTKTRELYYAVEKTIPLTSSPHKAAMLGSTLKRARRERQIRSGHLPPDLTFFEGFVLFFSRPSNVFWFSLAAVAIFAFVWVQRQAVS